MTEKYKKGQWFKFVEEFGLYSLDEPVQFNGNIRKDDIQLVPYNWDGGGGLGWTPKKYVEPITDEQAQLMISMLKHNKNLSRERYQNFLRVAEDIESQDYLYDMQIRIGKVNANEVAFILSKYTSAEIEQDWTVNVLASYDNEPSQVGPIIRVSISTHHSRSMTNGQYMDFINFSLRSKLIVDILMRRMSDAVRGVVNA